MSDAPTAQLPPNPTPPPDPPRRLTRSSSDRVLAGVAGGLARHFELDPVLVRLAFVLLTIFAGSGVLLYVVLALVLPGDTAHDPAAPAARPSDSTLSKGAIAVLILVALVALPFVGGGLVLFAPGLIALALFAALAVFLVRALGGERTTSEVLLALLAVLVAVVVGIGAGLATAFGGGTAVAVVVLAVGVVLVVGGLLGGIRWLVVPALCLALPVVLVVAADIDLRGGVGNREARPASVADVKPAYRLGVGRLVVDVRDVPFTGRTDVKLDVKVGQAQLIVPRGVCVQTAADVNAGQVNVLGRRSEGVDVGSDQRPQPRPGRPLLVVDAKVGVGEVVVSQRRRADGDFGGTLGLERQPACR